MSTISGRLIREARLRAGLSQIELSEVSGKDRTQIARWERGEVSPSFDTLLQILRSAGFDLPPVLVPWTPAEHRAELSETAMLTPKERYVRMVERLEGGAG